MQHFVEIGDIVVIEVVVGGKINFHTVTAVHADGTASLSNGELVNAQAIAIIDQGGGFLAIVGLFNNGFCFHEEENGCCMHCGIPLNS